MSWGGWGNNNSAQTPQNVDPEIDEMLTMAKSHAKLFNRMLSTCFEKCVDKYSESHLAVGEAVCTERCAIKYFQTYQKLSIRLNNKNANTVPGEPDSPFAE